jgi:ATP-dependent RNA helicase RhlE
MTFHDLNLIAPLLESLSKQGYSQPTPIQEKAIPHILEGKDILGCAQTGTGKTAAFALPILQLLSKQENNGSYGIKALVLAPTRELALQIHESFKAYGSNMNLKYALVFGGVSQHGQVNTLRKGVDIVIATPGRLLDLIEQGHVKLSTVKYFVLDEADRMLDMGFINDIRKIIAKLPVRKQTVFLSATISPEIRKLTDKLLYNPVSINIEPVTSTSALIQQGIYYVSKENKRALLRHILNDAIIENALVFTRTKRGADKVVKELNRNKIKAEAIHGNKSQNAREKALRGFKNRTTRVLVATDIASRGIDIDNLTHVINFELPEEAATYVHRIGRTGRAGAQGTAVSFCSPDEVPYLRSINKLLHRTIEEIKGHPFGNSNGTDSFKNKQRA